MNKELLEILACPECKESIELKSNKLICKKCREYYPIRDGIPVVLVDEAKDYKK